MTTATTAAARAAGLSDVVGFDRVHAQPRAEPTDADEHMTGLTVIDAHSLQVSLVHADSDFVRVLATVIAQPRSAVDQTISPQLPDCVGPYAFDPGTKLQTGVVALHRDARYYGGNTAVTRGGAGYFDHLQFNIFPTASALAQAWQHHVVAVGVLPPGAAAPASASAVLSSRGSIDFIGLPLGRAPFDQPLVRRALSEAIDRTALARIAYGGLAAPADGFLPPTVGEVFHRGACGLATPATADVTAARADLIRAHVRLDGITADLLYDNDPPNAAVVTAVAKMWRDSLGLVVRPRSMAWNDYLALAQGAQGLGGFFRESWRSEVPSADSYLAPLFASSSVGDTNFARYGSPTFDDALTKRARRADDSTDRMYDYRQAEKILCSDLPMLPLVFTEGALLVDRSAVHKASTYTDPTTGLPNWPDLFGEENH